MKLFFILTIIFQFYQSATASIFTKDQWIDFYLRDCSTINQNQACKQDLEKALGKMYAYRKIVFKYLDKNGLPHNLATIPIIESLYNEKAISKAGAIGLWQLMPFHIENFKTKEKTIGNRIIEITPTEKAIKKYGFNPVLSTEIASSYLKYLYEVFKHYKDCDQYVIMAYNAGDSKIKKWIDGKEALPDETINFYNKFMAIQHIIKNMDELDINPQQYHKIFIIDYFLSFI